MNIIDEIVPDIADFIFRYNRLINRLVTEYRAQGALETSMNLRQWRFRDKDINDSGFVLHLTNKGSVILDCSDEKFIPEFEDFWREYKERWGITSKDADLETLLQGINMTGDTVSPEPTSVLRGRKRTSIEEQRAIAAYYIENQATLSYEQVGRIKDVSGKTVQRYVEKYNTGKL